MIRYSVYMIQGSEAWAAGDHNTDIAALRHYAALKEREAEGLLDNGVRPLGVWDALTARWLEGGDR